MNIEWRNLSDEAKSVIEWVENPFTNKKENIEIQINVNFQREIPFCVEEHSSKIDIPMTAKLFSEIIKYVANDNNLETVSYNANINKYIFKLKEDVKWH